MVFTDLPLVERVRRHPRRSASRSRSGTGRAKDIDALAATGARFTSMTGYVARHADRPGRRRRAARHRRAVDPGRAPARHPDASTCTAPGWARAACRCGRSRSSPGAMWVAAADTLRAGRRAGRARGRRVLPGEPQHRGRPPRHAVRPGRRHACALVRGRRQPAPADDAGPLPRPDRRGEPDRAGPRAAAPRSARSRSPTCPGRCEPGTGEINYPAVARALAEMGYAGVVGLEAFASATASARWSGSGRRSPSDHRLLAPGGRRTAQPSNRLRWSIPSAPYG